MIINCKHLQIVCFRFFPPYSHSQQHSPISGVILQVYRSPNYIKSFMIFPYSLNLFKSQENNQLDLLHSLQTPPLAFLSVSILHLFFHTKVTIHPYGHSILYTSYNYSRILDYAYYIFF